MGTSLVCLRDRKACVDAEEREKAQDGMRSEIYTGVERYHHGVGFTLPGGEKSGEESKQGSWTRRFPFQANIFSFEIGLQAAGIEAGDWLGGPGKGGLLTDTRKLEKNSQMRRVRGCPWSIQAEASQSTRNTENRQEFRLHQSFQKVLGKHVAHKTSHELQKMFAQG